ncbi:MAG: magnesium transporter CorA family protein [Synergistaceae bacterium]|jgi:magnesium transporter|nr:magnesium transporter CorA family protein [Synergistaceae bacterium]
MLKIYNSTPDGLCEPDLSGAGRVASGAWFNLTKPGTSELREVSELTGAPMDFLQAALDREEPSRIEVEDDYVLIITNVPKVDDGSSFGYDTIPLGIIVSSDYIVTVCLEENEVLDDFDSIHHLFFDTRKRTRFLLQILYKCAVIFLKDLRVMNKRTDDIEQDLRRSMKNKELFLLLDMQKTLTYFTVALRSNKNVVERLTRLFANPAYHNKVKLREDDEELLEDVRIEFDQAIEMVQMHGEVLASMMDAFASVISNNLNIVMKFLTSVTIVMSIPTMIASFFGMNVPVPWQGSSVGFVYAMIVAMFLTISVTVIFWKKKMF